VLSNTLVLTSPNVTYVRTNVTWNGQALVFKDPNQGTLTVSPSGRGLLERIDLGLGAFLPDSDGDGLPDWWEQLHFGSPTAADRDADTDGDGLSNWKEYIAGTNPRDAASSLEFVRVTEESPGVVVVEWSSVVGKKYTLLRSPTLSTDPRDYDELQSGIDAQGTVTSYRDTTADGTYFYRVRVVE
jgi:hypothetical protein